MINEKYQQYLTMRDLERITGIRTATWRYWIRTERLPSLKLGKIVLVETKAFEKYMEDHKK